MNGERRSTFHQARRSSGSVLVATLVIGILGVTGTTSGPESVGPPMERTGAQAPAMAATVTTQGYLTMADGVDLAYTVVTPEGDGPWPTLFEYSGYNPGREPDRGYVRRFVEERGDYAYIGVNLRGTGCSDGVFDFFQPQEAKDGAAVIEWIVDQPFSNGDVAMIGKSYPGITQLFVAAENPEGLVAIAPGHFFADAYRDVALPGGIANHGFATLWSFIARPSYEFTESLAYVAKGDLGCLRGLTGMVRSLHKNPYLQLLQHPFDDALTRERSPNSRLADLVAADIPLFTTLAWQDEQLSSRQSHLLADLEEAGAENWWAILTNGDHGMYRTRRALDELERFLDHFVLGIDNGWDERARVEVWWEAGRDGARAPGWVTELAGWSEAGRRHDSGLVPTAMPLDAGGMLRTDPAVTGSASTDYVYAPVIGSQGVANPAYALPDLPDRYFWDLAPPDGTAAAFTTERFTEDITMLGSASLDLWFRAIAPDVDFQVTLTEVRPDGAEVFVQHGWLRASQRALDEARSSELRPYQTHAAPDAALVVPGEPTHARIEVFPFGHVFREGSRMRVWITAPTFLPELWAFTPSPVPTPVSILHDERHPSRLVVPVVPSSIAMPTTAPPCGSVIRQPCRTDPLPPGPAGRADEPADERAVGSERAPGAAAETDPGASVLFDPPPTSAPKYGIQPPSVDPGRQRATVEAADGTGIFIETWLPAPSEGHVPPDRVPVVVSISPYLWRKGVESTWALNNLVPRGYAYANVHVRGTGGSGGCIDLGGRWEADDGARAIEYLGRDAPFSDGNVGAYGISYPGGTPLNAAGRGDPARTHYLKAIVSGAPFNSAHEAQWTFDGVPSFLAPFTNVGAYFLESMGVDFNNPGNSNPTIDQLLERVECQGSHALAAIDWSGNHTAWHRDRDSRAWVQNITAPILMFHGHADLIPNGGSPPSIQRGLFDMISADTPKAGVFGVFGHTLPTAAHPRIEDMVIAWFDRWLRDIDNGADGWPIAQVQGTDGHWRTEADWPTTGGPVGQLALGSGKDLGVTQPAGSTIYVEGPLETTVGSLPATAAVFETSPIPERLELTGQPVLDLWVTLAVPDAHIAARLEVLDAAGNPIPLAATYGLRSAQHLEPFADGRFVQSAPVPPPILTPIRVPIRFQPTDLVVPDGGRLRLTVAGSLIVNPGLDQFGIPEPLFGGPSQPSGVVAPVIIHHSCQHPSALRFHLPAESSAWVTFGDDHPAPPASGPAPADGQAMATAPVCGKAPERIGELGPDRGGSAIAGGPAGRTAPGFLPVEDDDQRDVVHSAAVSAHDVAPLPRTGGGTPTGLLIGAVLAVLAATVLRRSKAGAA